MSNPITQKHVLGQLARLLDSAKRRRESRGFVTLRIAPNIICADGLRLSVQASQSHYCTPRNNVGPWTHVEVGFPNRECPLLNEYAEDPESKTETVYAWVPIEKVAQTIVDAGGIEFPEIEP